MDTGMEKQVYKSFQWRWTIFIGLGLSLIAMGASVHGFSPLLDFISVIFIAAGGMMIMAGLIYALPSSNSLEIKDTGFSYRNGLKTIFCRWEDCDEFSTWRQSLFGMTSSELVTFNTKNPVNSAQTNVKTTGKNGVLPGTYGMDADDLVAKLNSFRTNYISSLPTAAA